MNKIEENAKVIEHLAEIMSKHNLSKINLTLDDFTLTLESQPVHPPMPIMPMPPVMHVNANSPIPSVTLNNSDEIKPQTTEEPKGSLVKSPIVGTFYASPAPDKAPFVTAGTDVKAGDVVCIIESMKLMNEIQSEFSGKVAEIYVKNGEAVEYGQPLIRLV